VGEELTPWFAGLLSSAETVVGEPIRIIELAPEARGPELGVLGASRHSVRRLKMETQRCLALAVPSQGILRVVAQWVNCYERNDFAALHTDRPDSAFTALRAAAGRPEPIVICPSLSDLSTDDLLAYALQDPHPEGVNAAVTSDRWTVFRGSRIPHHRRPVVEPCAVVSISLAVDSAPS
jgi:hypothetical protein